MSKSDNSHLKHLPPVTVGGLNQVMNKKILKLLEQATKKFKEAEAAEQKLSKAVTFVGFEPDDEPRISYFGADGFILIWHGHEVYDWLSLLSGDNSICREQLQFNEDYGVY